MENQVSDQVLRGVYLAARMASDLEVTDADYAGQFPDQHVETDAVEHQSRACVSYCVDGRVSNPFNMQRNMVIVDRNIAGRLARTPTLQFAHEERRVDVAMSAGHEDCNGVGAAVAELDRIIDQIDGDHDLLRRLVANRCDEMDRSLHPKEKHMYELLCDGGMDVYRELHKKEGKRNVREAMAEELARQEVYNALRKETVRNLVKRGRLVLGSFMIRFPEVRVERSELTMIAYGDGDEISLVYGSEILDQFGEVVEDAFTDDQGNLHREQMEQRCTSTWISEHVPLA